LSSFLPKSTGPDSKLGALLASKPVRSEREEGS
jgi:hypothetical protein